MQSHLKIEMRRSGSVKEFLTEKWYRKAIFIGIGKYYRESHFQLSQSDQAGSTY